MYLANLIFVISVAVVVGSGDVGASPCPNMTQMSSDVESNHDYVWIECSPLSTMTRWTITAVGIDLINVGVQVQGGAALPFIDFTSLQSLTNVSIRVVGVVQNSTAASTFSDALLVLPGYCKNFSIVLHSCRFKVDLWSRSFISNQIGGMPMHMSDVYIAFQFCTIDVALSRQSLVILHLPNNSVGISVVLEDSSIGATTTGVDVRLFYVGSVVTCDLGVPNLVATDLVLRLQRSNILFIQNCSDASSLCGNSTNPVDGSVQMSYCAAVYWDAPNTLMIHAELYVKDTVFQSILVRPLNDNDATRVSRGMTLFWVSGSTTCHCSLSQLSVYVFNVTASIESGQAASLLQLDRVDELSDTVIMVQDSHIDFSAQGALNNDGSTRYATVVHIYNETIGPNLTIQLIRVVSSLSLLSGEQLPSAVAASPLSITYAALVYCTAYIKQRPRLPIAVVVLVRDCMTTTEISNGSLPFYRPTSVERFIGLGLQWPPIAVYTMISTLLLFDRQHNIAIINVSIANCSLRSIVGLTMRNTASAVGPSSATVTSVIALMTITANCTNSSFDIRDSFVEVTSMSFLKPSTQLSNVAVQERSALDVDSGFLFLNITSLFQAFDVIPLGQYAINKALSAPQFQPAKTLMKEFLSGAFASAIVYDSVRLSVTHSTVLYPTTLSLYPADVVAFVLTPTIASHSTIDILGSSPLSSGQSPHPATVVGMLGSDLENCTVTVTDLNDAGPLIVASLGQSQIGHRTAFVFTNSSFRTTTGVSSAVFVSGFNASLIINLVANTVSPSGTWTMVTFDISDDTFSGGLTTIFGLSGVHWAPNTEWISRPAKAVHLGCNLVDGRPLLTSNIGGIPKAALHNVVDYPPGHFHGGIAADSLPSLSLSPWCVGLADEHTPTITLTTSPDNASFDDLQSPIPVSPTSVTAASWFAGVASLTALLMFSPSALIDGQTLAAIGGSSCATSSLKKSTSVSQYVLSPFYPLGPAAMVLGNVGLAVFILVTHAVAVFQVFPRMYSNKAVSNSNPLHNDINEMAIVDDQTSVRVSWGVRLQFPNHSLTACTMLVQGIVYGATSELFTPSPLHILCGVVGLGFIVAAWLARRHVELSHQARLLQWRPYPHRIVASQQWVPRWVLPLGRWEPEAVRMTHGRLRGPVRVTCEAYALYPLLCSLVVSVAAGLPVPPLWCVLQWSALTCVPLAGCAIALAVRPARAPLSDALYAVGYVLQLALFVTMALLASGRGDGASEASAVGVLSIMSSLSCVLRLMHTQFISWWEAQFQRMTASTTVECQKPPSVSRTSLAQLEQLITLICSSRV